MRLPLTAILTASGLATAGCMKEEAAMFIEGALPLVPEECEVAAGDNVFLSNGILDLGGGSGYTVALKVRTNLPATFNNQDVQQDQTRSPNYQDYGAVDNNVVIFESAEVTFTLQSDADTIGTLGAAASPEIRGNSLSCADGVCGSPIDPDNPDRRIPEIIPAAGTVFNTQTQLNQPAVVFSEVLSASTAQTLRAVYEAAAALESQDLADRTFLDVPGETQRLNLEIVLVGRTTGSQNLRTVRSAPFPFGIDVCIGCLAPDAELCRKFNAVPVAVVSGANNDPAQTCFVGQDFLTAACVCVDNNGDGVPDAVGTPNAQPLDLPVVNDAGVCRPRP